MCLRRWWGGVRVDEEYEDLWKYHWREADTGVEIGARTLHS